MFGLGVPEIIIILVIALILVGPKRLPDVGQSLGKAVREFRKGAEELKKDVETGVGLDEQSREELKEALTLEEPPAKETAPETKVPS